MNISRSQYEEWFPNGHRLRDLAHQIASTDPVGSGFLSDKNSLPYNLLVNSAVGCDWEVPNFFNSKGLAKWKAGSSHDLSLAQEQGFAGAGHSRKGLALMFDPLVDGFLAAHSSTANKLPVEPTLIVLSDYYPLSLLAKDSSFKGDWGETQTGKILRAEVSGDTTLRRLFQTLAPDGTNTTTSAGFPFPKHPLLVWNFFPFFRGGDKPEGRSGLPISGLWRERCWDFLCSFIDAIGAVKVLLACSKQMLPLPLALLGDDPKPRVNLMPDIAQLETSELKCPEGNQSFAPPPKLTALFAKRRPEIQSLHRIYHPRSWSNPSCNDSRFVTQILNDQPYHP